VADYNQWLILEVNEMSDNVPYKDMARAITSVFGDDIDFFVPIHHEQMGTYNSTCTLMEGYAFVRDTPEVRENIVYFHEQRVFSNILSQGGKYQTINSRAIGVLKKKLHASMKRRFEVGKKVKVLEGVFKNLIGEVVSIEENGKQIMIRIQRISREILAPIPATLLEEVE
jgi:transcription antitermination factor NusG